MILKSAKVTLSMVVIIAIISMAGMYFESQGILLHNRKIAELKKSDLAISAICTAMFPPRDGVEKKPNTAVISDEDDKMAILRSLIVDNTFQSTYTYHECSGNIQFILTKGKSVYYVQYDHGSGIYPITRSENGASGGFLDIRSDKCDILNSVLRKYGFTDEEIGCIKVGG